MEKYVRCWQVLRVSDKFSNATASAAAGFATSGGANGSDESEETDEPSNVGRSIVELGSAAAGFTGRATGNTAALRVGHSEAVAAREAK